MVTMYMDPMMVVMANADAFWMSVTPILRPWRSGRKAVTPTLAAATAVVATVMEPTLASATCDVGSSGGDDARRHSVKKNILLEGFELATFTYKPKPP